MENAIRYIAADCLATIAHGKVYDHALAIRSDGTILDIVPLSTLAQKSIRPEYFEGVFCPGFVNAHCHLELSWAKGALPKGGGLDAFIRGLMALRTDGDTEDRQAQILQGYREMVSKGVVAIADIANGLNSLVCHDGASYIHTFVELFGSDPQMADPTMGRAKEIQQVFSSRTGHQATLTPHSAYSVSGPLMQSLLELKEGIYSLHHLESAEEIEFFGLGTGPLAARRKDFTPQLPPYESNGIRPLASLLPFAPITDRVLLVHNTFAEEADIELIEAILPNAALCLCPRSNRYIENRLPNLELLRKSHLPLTLGTDSLASNDSLDIFEEIKTLHHYHSSIPVEEMLQWATWNGAHFLHLDPVLGSLEAGKRPGIVHLTGIDPSDFTLTHQSASKLLIPAL